MVSHIPRISGIPSWVSAPVVVSRRRRPWPPVAMPVGAAHGVVVAVSSRMASVVGARSAPVTLGFAALGRSRGWIAGFPVRRVATVKVVLRPGVVSSPRRIRHGCGAGVWWCGVVWCDAVCGVQSVWTACMRRVYSYFSAPRPDTGSRIEKNKWRSGSRARAGKSARDRVVIRSLARRIFFLCLRPR